MPTMKPRFVILNKKIRRKANKIQIEHINGNEQV